MAVKKTAAKAAEEVKNTAEKAVTEVKSTAKKTATAAKSTAKKTTEKAKKVAEKASAVKSVEAVKVQFSGAEYDVAAVVAAAKADYKKDNKAAIKSISVYIKPEDSAAYYVVNDSVNGKVDL
ncbi:hypothetical protein SAMN02910447_02173 [Ruminococcus sp. YE71]|uniref:DUF6465 family protein n=1 Tax=unclassified Ruminococcus TaxID=2608920 RepID=UPI000887B60E|nr:MULTISPECIES: DUF6465 family protein [unclassified Ruminococcus]SDA22233.1 hypothetical protein SAMN02910446_02042 [Ruminococcus sp. YE78]SFW37681.1 hypothetical protein SAMN02910447_02173 [Ruminococcus sp. YE71]